MKKEAEYRVYVVSANDIDSNYLSLEDMMQWDEKGVITPQAEEFIKKAEEVGSVYSLMEFAYDCNSEELNLSNSWIFISKLYNENYITANLKNKMEKSRQLESWAATHYEIVTEIERRHREYEDSHCCTTSRLDGFGSRWELAYDLTNEFEELHKDTEWKFNKGFLETLEEFLASKNL